LDYSTFLGGFVFLQKGKFFEISKKNTIAVGVALTMKYVLGVYFKKNPLENSVLLL
jgi:hypothetical protein